MAHLGDVCHRHLAETSALLALLGAAAAPVSLSGTSSEDPASRQQVQAFLLKAESGSVQGGYGATYIESYNVTTPLNPGHLIDLESIQDTPYLRIYRATPGFRAAGTGTAPAGYEVFMWTAGLKRPRLLNASPGTYTCRQANPAARWSCTRLTHISPAEQNSLVDWFPGFELFNELSNASSYYSLVPPVAGRPPHGPRAVGFLSTGYVAGSAGSCLTIRSAKANEKLGKVCIGRHEQVAYLKLPVQASAGIYQSAELTHFSNYVPKEDLRLPLQR